MLIFFGRILQQFNLYSDQIILMGQIQKTCVKREFFSINNFNEKFGTDIPEDSQYETLGGFLSKITGHIPEVNEEIRHDNIRFTVMKKSPRRIRQIRVAKVPQGHPGRETA